MKSSYKSLPMQEFRNCQRYLTAAKRLGCFVDTRFSPGLEAALILLPFQSTDPKQRVNPQSRLPEATNGPGKCSNAPGFHWFDQSWMARDYERVTGTCSFLCILELIRAHLGRARSPTIRTTPFYRSVVRELRCSLKHARSLG